MKERKGRKDGRKGSKGKIVRRRKGKGRGGVSIRVSPEKSSPKGHWLLVSCPIVHAPPGRNPLVI